jgi:hypothetical protein
MRDNVSADRADPGINPAASDGEALDWAVNLPVLGWNRPKNWAARNPNARLIIDRL